MLRKVLISHHSLNFYEIHMIHARCLNSVREGGFTIYRPLSWLRSYNIIITSNKKLCSNYVYKLEWDYTDFEFIIRILFATIDDILTFFGVKNCETRYDVGKLDQTAELLVYYFRYIWQLNFDPILSQSFRNKIINC